jgi:glycine cleavage system pyridoxal-binding protein P
MKEFAIQNVKKTQYLIEKIQKLTNIKLIYKKPVYNEFCIQFPGTNQMESFINKLIKADICPPLKLEEYNSLRKNQLLFCVTEMLDKETLDLIASFLKEADQ